MEVAEESSNGNVADRKGSKCAKGIWHLVFWSVKMMKELKVLHETSPSMFFVLSFW